MNNTFLYKRKYLFVICLIWVLIGFLWLILKHKGEAILMLNESYNSYSVPFFNFFTRMAEWMGFVFPFLFLLLFKSIRMQLGFIMVGVLTLILVFGLKNLVFDDAIRPIVFFENLDIPLLNRSEIPLNRKHSFPSGHTAAGFAYFFYLALCADKKFFSISFIVIAILIGLSRVFLAQHFVADVVAGSVLGVSIATSVYYLWIYKNRDIKKPIDRKLFNAKA